MTERTPGDKIPAPLPSMRWWAWSWLVVVTLGVISIAMAVATNRISEQRIARDAPLGSAVAEIQSSLANAHLLLEEYFTMGAEADVAEAWRLMQRVEHLSGALLLGGLVEAGAGTRPPLMEPGPRGQAERLRSLLVDFRDVAGERVRIQDTGRSDRALEERYDLALEELLGEALALEGSVQAQIQDNRVKAARLFAIILVVWLLLVILAASGLASREAHRRRAEEALARSEERLAATLRSIGDGVITTDARGRVTFANAAAVELVGPELASAIGRPLSELYRVIDDNNGEQVQSSFSRVLSERQVRAAEGWILVRLDDRRVPIDESAAPILDAEGTMTGAVLVLRDISERKEAEAALLESQAQLRRSQKLEAVGRLAGGLAHDINNYLGVISNESELARRFRNDPDEVAARIDAVQDSIARTSSLLRQLLAFGRRQTPRREWIDLNQVAEGLSPMLHRLVGEGKRLVIEGQKDLPPVRLDPSQIEQVLVNLVINAEEAIAGKGTVRVEIGTAEIDGERAAATPGAAPGRYAVLAVSDDGHGIAEGVRENIFEPFFTTRQAKGNSGLGLSTVYGIVQQNGGFIRVDSTEGRGSCFRLYFPCADEGRLEPVPPCSGRSAGGRSLRILLVEDDEPFRRSTRTLLALLGHLVFEAASAEEALDMLWRTERPFDLVITDYAMPGLDGGELIGRIRARDRSIRLIVMSGRMSEESLRDLIPDERVGFLAKPFAPGRLEEKIAQAL